MFGDRARGSAQDEAGLAGKATNGVSRGSDSELLWLHVIHSLVKDLVSTISLLFNYQAMSPQVNEHLGVEVLASIIFKHHKR